ncbi:MAG TPA: M48 family metallopeptidase [Planctomycetota bacterium]|nr:M48 family metallopeptidase [Planctomycetota bacterium]
MASSASLAGRALLAVVLLIIFYALAIGISLGLFAIAYLHATTSSRVYVKLVAGCVITGCVILWSIVPRPDKFEPPGPRLDPRLQPELFAFLKKIADAVGQAMPVDVYLVPDVNAFVTQRGGIMGMGSKRVMGLGLPLMQVLSVNELRGVIAHEFGHFAGGDTKLGPWIYKTRSALVRTIVNLQGGIAGWFFLQYFKLFLWITQAISRAQEYAADQHAAELVGSKAFESGLRMTRGAAVAFNSYMDSEYLPVLSAGFRPPLAEGFATFLGSEEIAKKLDELVEKAAKSETSDPYDSHPALKERIRAIQSLPAGDEQEDDPHAISLLGESVDALEKELVGMVLGVKARKLEAISWQETTDKVTVPRWKEMLAEHGKALAGVTPAALADDPKRLSKIGGSFAKGAPPAEFKRAGAALVGTAIAYALIERGYTAKDEVGKSTELTKDGVSVAIFEKLGKLAEGELAPEKWKKLCDQLEIADLDLASLVPANEPKAKTTRKRKL